MGCSAVFAQAACAKKQAGENIIRFKGEEADPMFRFACTGEVIIESVKNGQPVTQTIPASEAYIASVQADANTYVTLRGDVVSVAFGNVNYEEQTYELYQVTDLDTRENKILMSIACIQCKLTALDVSANTALTLLSCDSNQTLISISYPATNENVSTAIASAITAATSTTGTVYTDSAGAYYSTIETAATTKGWTIEQIA